MEPTRLSLSCSQLKDSQPHIRLPPTKALHHSHSLLSTSPIALPSRISHSPPHSTPVHPAAALMASPNQLPDINTLMAMMSVLQQRATNDAQPGRPHAGVNTTARTDLDQFADEMNKRAASGSIMANRWIKAHQIQDDAVKLLETGAPTLQQLSKQQLVQAMDMLQESYELCDFCIWPAEDAELCHNVAVHLLRIEPNRNASILVARDAGDPRVMYRMYTQLLSQYPNDPHITYCLGCLSGFMNKPGEGVKLLQKALSLGVDPGVYFVLGGALRCAAGGKNNKKGKGSRSGSSSSVASGDMTASDAFRKFLELNPIDHRHTPESNYGLALEYLMDGDLSEARRYYQAGLDAEAPHIRLPCVKPVGMDYEPLLILKQRFPTLRASSKPKGVNESDLHPYQSAMHSLGEMASGKIYDMHEAGDSSTLPIEALTDRTGETSRAHYRKQLALTTNLAMNDADQCGDGDQSTVRARGPGDRGQTLFDVWGSGADFNPYSPTLGRYISEFHKACYAGDLTAVQSAIDAAEAEDRAEERGGPGVAINDDATSSNTSSSTDAAATSSSNGTPTTARLPPPPGSHLFTLLNSRTSLLRLSPLLTTIAGARSFGKGLHPREAMGKWVEVARLLATRGANLLAKDVAGHTAIHHCVTVMSSSVSIEIARILLESPLDGGFGVPVDQRNRADRTPLMDAVMSRRIENVRVLMEYGDANPLATELDGISPMKLAQLFPEALMLFTQRDRRLALLHPTAIVELRGLVTNYKLNGLKGRCQRYLPRTGRMAVEIARSEEGDSEVESKEGEAAAAVDANAAASSKVVHVLIDNIRLSDERALSGEGEKSNRCSVENCSRPGSKVCTRCLTAKYCSRQCQMDHWKVHKKLCKQLATGKVSIPVSAPVPTPAVGASPASKSGIIVDRPSGLGVKQLPSNMQVTTIGWGQTEEHVTDLGASAAGIRVPKPGSKAAKEEAKKYAANEPGGAAPQAFESVILKVQVPMMPLNDPSHPDLLVYDRSRSWTRVISDEHPQYAAIVRAVRSSSTGLKAYFHATITIRGEVAFGISELAPPQDW